ncbi:schlafen-like protein 1 isoform X1 [Sarcophilus harrisii]|uniref:schlafen-like protein 1 isoform X1 n=1 Tax=Sarcophilus harrisii TaxID=9305 RepID=UPI001301D13C|nr:schlafen-like protein 1 isoform X1 [Sarcophilus harrisii]XP_031818172.1 schlafen-like protein 1 isoform X1 [Sarcophilus harrisii]XP_031818174.1 schlafen-like protein 1 isoform X1 [Sarcophilus harrisii]
MKKVTVGEELVGILQNQKSPLEMSSTKPSPKETLMETSQGLIPKETLWRPTSIGEATSKETPTDTSQVQTQTEETRTDSWESFMKILMEKTYTEEPLEEIPKETPSKIPRETQQVEISAVETLSDTLSWESLKEIPIAGTALDEMLTENPIGESPFRNSKGEPSLKVLAEESISKETLEGRPSGEPLHVQPPPEEPPPEGPLSKMPPPLHTLYVNHLNPQFSGAVLSCLLRDMFERLHLPLEREAIRVVKKHRRAHALIQVPTSIASSTVAQQLQQAAEEHVLLKDLVARGKMLAVSEGPRILFSREPQPGLPTSPSPAQRWALGRLAFCPHRLHPTFQGPPAPLPQLALGRPLRQCHCAPRDRGAGEALPWRLPRQRDTQHGVQTRGRRIPESGPEAPRPPLCLRLPQQRGGQPLCGRRGQRASAWHPLRPPGGGPSAPAGGLHPAGFQAPGVSRGLHTLLRSCDKGRRQQKQPAQGDPPHGAQAQGPLGAAPLRDRPGRSVPAAGWQHPGPALWQCHSGVVQAEMDRRAEQAAKKGQCLDHGEGASPGRAESGPVPTAVPAALLLHLLHHVTGLASHTPEAGAATNRIMHLVQKRTLSLCSNPCSGPSREALRQAPPLAPP